MVYKTKAATPDNCYNCILIAADVFSWTAAIGRLCEKCKLNLPVSRNLNYRVLCSKLSVPAGDGKCVICDSYVRPATLVRICDECNYGSYAGRCTICGGIGISDAYYCKECTLQEKDVRLLLLPSYTPILLVSGGSQHDSVRLLQRDGCPKIVNLGSAKTDLFYERKKYGFKKR